MRNSSSQRIKEIAVFAVLGSLMFCSKIVMEALPNVHLLGALTMTYTVVFRKKALIPIYVYVFLNGLYAGFNMWWVPYLYIWTVLWGVTMLLPRNMPRWAGAVVYPVVCFLHGILFGALYAPAQALFFKMDFQMTVAWVLAGTPFDVLHAVGNAAACLLTLPLVRVLCRLEKKEMMI